MATQGKGGLKRSKPNYIFSIIGVALVLFIMGIMGWFFLNVKQAGNLYKEDIRFSAYLRTLNKDTISQIQQFITQRDYAKEVIYINKDKAKEIWNKQSNEDWAKFLTENPLPESIDFHAKAEYVNRDSMEKISNELLGLYGNQITDLQYPRDLVNNLDEKAKVYGLAFLVISIILCAVVIFSIDNTIRLAMFSNRFLIKTMQMVGATRGFITRPMDIKAVVNGCISGLVAVALLFSLIQWVENQIPELKTIDDIRQTMMLFGGMILLGVGISLLSTHRSVIKYLKMKLDELY